jgi:hypothetical protein
MAATHRAGSIATAPVGSLSHRGGTVELRFPGDTERNVRGPRMVLSQTHRHTIFERLAPTLGEEETEALLSQFPTSERDEPVTNDRLDASIAGVRADFSDLKADFSDLKADVARMEAALVERMRQQAMWTFGAMISGMGIAAAIAQAIG